MKDMFFPYDGARTILLLISAMVFSCDNSNPIDSRFAPKISWQPQSQVVLLGNPADFSVSVSGDPAPTFQWNKGGTPLSGGTDSLYTIPAVAFADSGTYSVVASNSQGTVSSDPVSLTVYALTVQPRADTVYVDSSFTFTAVLEGISAPAFQWRLNGFDISGATSLTYSKDAATPDDAGTYQLIVFNAADDVYSEPVTLVVNP
jgi:hypothetical protein